MDEALQELKEILEEWNDIPLAADWDGALTLLDDKMDNWAKKVKDAVKELERTMRESNTP